MVSPSFPALAAAFPDSTGMLTFTKNRIKHPPSDLRLALEGFAASLLDHLIRPRQQRGRDREAERLGCLEVDQQFERRGLLNREISGLCAFENLVDVRRGPPKQRGIAWPIRHQPAQLPG